MKPLSIVLLIAEAAAASALAAAVTAFAIRQGAGPWIIHPALALVFVVVAGVLLWMVTLLQLTRSATSLRSIMPS